MFAVQTVVCGNISESGDMSKSDLILLNLTSATEISEVISMSTSIISSHFDDTDVRFYTVLASASFFAILFALSTIVFITVTIHLVKGKAKLQAAVTVHLTANTNTQNTFSLPEDITATENIAYGHISRLGMS